jgi:hypothetical protein
LATYKIWLHDSNGEIQSTIHEIHFYSSARRRFETDVKSPVLDGKDLFVACSFEGKVFARHSFMKKSGKFFLKDKLDKVEWPIPVGAGRPTEMRQGGKVTVYLDADSITKAKEIADGNLSEGIRIAIKNF